MSTSPMTTGKRLVLAAAWGMLCGAAYCAAAEWQRNLLGPGQWLYACVGVTLGAVIAEGVVRRLSPSLQLLSLTASLGGVAAAVTSNWPERWVVPPYLALTATATASVVNLFAARRSRLVRAVGAYALCSFACLVVCALTAIDPSSRGLASLHAREFAFFAAFGLFGCAGVPPLPPPSD